MTFIKGIRRGSGSLLCIVSTMQIFLDPGHGIETPGKRSTDDLFREYEYNRIIASRVTSELLDCGYDAQLLVPKASDIPENKAISIVQDSALNIYPYRILPANNSILRTKQFYLHLFAQTVFNVYLKQKINCHEQITITTHSRQP